MSSSNTNEKYDNITPCITDKSGFEVELGNIEGDRNHPFDKVFQKRLKDYITLSN